LNDLVDLSRQKYECIVHEKREIVASNLVGLGLREEENIDKAGVS
jgi:hypothetical protein